LNIVETVPNPWLRNWPVTPGGLVAESPIFEFVSVVPNPPTANDRLGKESTEVSVTALVIPADMPEVLLKIGLPAFPAQGVGSLRQVSLYVEAANAALTLGLRVNMNEGPPVSAEPT